MWLPLDSKLELDRVWPGSQASFSAEWFSTLPGSVTGGFDIIVIMVVIIISISSDRSSSVYRSWSKLDSNQPIQLGCEIHSLSTIFLIQGRYSVIREYTSGTSRKKCNLDDSSMIRSSYISARFKLQNNLTKHTGDLTMPFFLFKLGERLKKEKKKLKTIVLGGWVSKGWKVIFLQGGW